MGNDNFDNLDVQNFFKFVFINTILGFQKGRFPFLKILSTIEGEIKFKADLWLKLN